MKNLNILTGLAQLIFIIVVSSCSKSAIENTVDALTPDIETPQDEDDTNNDNGNNDNNENDNEDEPIPSFTARINNTGFVASTVLTQSLTGATVNIGDSGYFLGITGQNLSQDLKSTEVILLYVFGADFDELSPNTEFNVTSNILGSVVPGAFAIYGGDPNVDVEDDNFGTEILEEIKIKITAIDKEKKLISGEFNFIATDEDTAQEYNVTEGVFTNLEYQIQ